MVRHIVEEVDPDAHEGHDLLELLTVISFNSLMQFLRQMVNQQPPPFLYLPLSLLLSDPFNIKPLPYVHLIEILEFLHRKLDT